MYDLVTERNDFAVVISEVPFIGRSFRQVLQRVRPGGKGIFFTRLQRTGGDYNLSAWLTSTTISVLAIGEVP